MARIYIPNETPLARAARGFGAPGVKPLEPLRPNSNLRDVRAAYVFSGNSYERNLANNSQVEITTTGTSNIRAYDGLVSTTATDTWHSMPSSAIKGTGRLINTVQAFQIRNTEAEVETYDRLIKLNRFGFFVYFLNTDVKIVFGLKTWQFAYPAWMRAKGSIITYVGDMDDSTSTKSKNFCVAVCDDKGNSLTLSSASEEFVDPPVTIYLGVGDGDFSRVYDASFRALIIARSTGAASEEKCLHYARNFWATFFEPANQSPILIGTEAAAATSQYFLPAQSPLTRALRGFGAPGVKPPIGSVLNRAHSLAPDLNCVIPRTTELRDMIDGVSPALGTNNTLTVVDGVEVLSCAGDAVTGDFTFASRNPATAPYTLVYRVKTPSTIINNFHRIMGIGSYDPGFALRMSFNGPWGLYEGTNVLANTVMGGNEWHTFAVVFSGSDRLFYLDGVADGTGSRTNTTSTGLHLGGSSVAYHEPADFEFVYSYGRVLSAAEIAEITRNPYQILEPANQPPIPIGTAGVVATQINATTDALTITEYNCTVEAGVATEIDATLDTLTLTEYNTTVSADTSVSATADSLTITEYAATISAGTNLSATSEALTLTEYNTTVSFNVNVSTTADTLTIIDYPVSLGTNVNAAVDALTITSYNASISLDVGVSATSEALTITDYNATVATGANVAATLDTLTITEYNVSVGYDTSLTATTDSLTITEYNATVQANVDTDITATLEALTLTEFNTNVAFGTGISATVDALTLTEYNATIGAVVNTNISAGVEALTLTEYNSSVSAPGTTTLTAQDIANIEAAFKNAVRSVLFVDNNT